MTETVHPKQLEAQKIAAQRAEMRKANKEFLAELNAQGVRFLEVGPEVDYDRNGRPIHAKHGRMTIAYLSMGRNVVAVSTTLCHPDDAFDKQAGRALAGHNMMMGHCIVLRKPTNTALTMRHWLSHQFTEFSE